MQRLQHVWLGVTAACCVIAGAGFSGHALAAEAFAEPQEIRCPEFPAPESGRRTWVAPNLRYNGLPMQIQEMTTEQPVQQVLEFYRRQWQGVKPGYFEYSVGPWQVIATIRDRCFFTVQAQPDGKGTRALLGISTPFGLDPGKQAGAGFPTMSGSKVLNDIDHFDAGKTGRMLLVTNEFSPDANLFFYRRALGGEGWVPVFERAVAGASGVSHVLVMKRGHNEANMAISRSRGTTSIVVTMVDRP